jgi:hypothetical protein
VNASSKRAVIATAAVTTLAVAFVVGFGLDISDRRYLTSDVLFRSAVADPPSYRAADPSSYSIWIPSLAFLHRSLAAGHLPLWDPAAGGGYSPVANFFPGIFSPLRLLAAALPERNGPTALLILALALAFAGTCVFLLERGASRTAAVGGGLAYALSGPLLSLAPLEIPVVASLLPWILVARDALTERATFRRFLLLAVTNAVLFTTGHPVYIFAVLLGASLEVTGSDARRAPRGMAVFAAAAASGALLAAPVLVPFLERLSTGWSYKTATAQGLAFEPRDLGSWLAEMRALAVSGPMESYIDHPQSYSFLGLPLLTFSAIGVWRPRGVAFVRSSVPITLLLAHPGPWMAFVAVIPLLRMTNPWYLGVPFAFAASIAAAAGLDALGRAWWRAIAVASIALPLLGHAGKVLALGRTVELPRSGGWELLASESRRERFRVTGLWGQVHQPNVASVTGIEDLRISGPIVDARYHAWFELVDPHVLEKSYPTTHVSNLVDQPLVRAFNVSYVLEGRRPFGWFFTEIDPRDAFPFIQDPPDRWPVAGCSIVYQDPELIIRAIPGAKPRAYVAEGIAITEPGIESAKKAIRSASASLDRLAIVEAPESARPALEAARGGRAVIESVAYPSGSSARLEVRAETAALIVLADRFEEGWRVAIDGAAAEILPVDLIARGVLIPPGQHTVEMTYLPPGLLEGLALSLATAVLLLVVVRRRMGA